MFSETDVLRRAQRIFLQHGFEATSYDIIAASTGLSKPSLYNAFGDKAALFEQALADYATNAGLQVLQTFGTGKTLAGATRAMLLAAADVYAPAAGPPAGCLLVGSALPACLQQERVQATLTDFLTTLDTDLETIIAERHLRQAHRTPRSLALQVSSLLMALAVRARTGLPRRKLRAFATELADTISDA